ncbi:Ribose import ATP-binding protein rbsA 2 [Nostocoides japonicum T1-X7]|uniref:Ribose import ATP-binding protein rbsA 2 n=1 Tax=Nostocoides japonicum T1-X7 TaxID=1194083 RepID=A0A077LUG9_9MICO|nr:sugar ABC transporter ATP-binding protein [Tetrasphaera japonica]CCH77473.1 Ribose import ATP-binding protein rbsA 2 [Tetrasphaera japonica T1-X7]
MTAPAISLRGISKSFDGVQALVDVSVDIMPGTIHALVGENGAGKSTLGKILAGVYHADEGQVLLAGAPVTLAGPREALVHGITIVAQEIALVGTRSVLENVYLGSESHTGPFVRTRTLRRRYAELVAETGIDVDADTLVDQLSIADQQKVEILRALARNADVIVMDEPTARLATHEAATLMTIFRGLRDQGRTIVFVSHFLEEVFSVSDHVTVLRDGRKVADALAADLTPTELITMMVGRSLDAVFPDKRASADSGDAVLQVRGLTRPQTFEDISFDVFPGEIVVVTGLVGSGRSEVVRSVYGLLPHDGGEVFFDGRSVRHAHPRQAIAHGMALIPESRKAEGLFLGFPVAGNIALPHLRRFTRWGIVDGSSLRRAAAEKMAAVGVKAASPGVAAGLLSGGNQQKILFARAFMSDLRLLIADEPTRGVDVGAKRQIYELLAELAARGTGVLVVSSEMEEVIGLAHRVIVMRRGRIAGQLAGDAITENAIAHLAFGQDATVGTDHS